MMLGDRLARGLAAQYYFTFGVHVQLVGDRRHTRVEERILHLDAPAGAIKLLQKGGVRQLLRFDAVNQIVFDEAEPRSVLVSCRDERRFFIDFQSAEDNLVFRAACYDLGNNNALDISRFQRAVLRKGTILKKGKTGAFSERYAILLQRKLLVLPSKVAVHASNAVSLVEVSPRFDELKGTIHLDVNGKEYVFKGLDREDAQEWFVAIVSSANLRTPVVLWDEPQLMQGHQELSLGKFGDSYDLKQQYDAEQQHQQGFSIPAWYAGAGEDFEDELPDHHLEPPAGNSWDLLVAQQRQQQQQQGLQGMQGPGSLDGYSMPSQARHTSAPGLLPSRPASATGLAPRDYRLGSAPPSLSAGQLQRSGGLQRSWSSNSSMQLQQPRPGGSFAGAPGLPQQLEPHQPLSPLRQQGSFFSGGPGTASFSHLGAGQRNIIVPNGPGLSFQRGPGSVLGGSQAMTRFGSRAGFTHAAAAAAATMAWQQKQQQQQQQEQEQQLLQQQAQMQQSQSGGGVQLDTIAEEHSGTTAPSPVQGNEQEEDEEAQLERYQQLLDSRQATSGSAAAGSAAAGQGPAHTMADHADHTADEEDAMGDGTDDDEAQMQEQAPQQQQTRQAGASQQSRQQRTPSPAQSQPQPRTQAPRTPVAPASRLQTASSPGQGIGRLRRASPAAVAPARQHTAAAPASSSVQRQAAARQGAATSMSSDAAAIGRARLGKQQQQQRQQQQEQQTWGTSQGTAASALMQRLGAGHRTASRQASMKPANSGRSNGRGHAAAVDADHWDAAEQEELEESYEQQEWQYGDEMDTENEEDQQLEEEDVPTTWARAAASRAAGRSGASTPVHHSRSTAGGAATTAGAGRNRRSMPPRPASAPAAAMMRRSADAPGSGTWHDGNGCAQCCPASPTAPQQHFYINVPNSPGACPNCSTQHCSVQAATSSTPVCSSCSPQHSNSWHHGSQLQTGQWASTLQPPLQQQQPQQLLSPGGYRSSGGLTNSSNSSSNRAPASPATPTTWGRSSQANLYTTAAAPAKVRGGTGLKSQPGNSHVAHYIIPSIVKGIVGSSEGGQLALELLSEPDMTPHQRCLQLLKWAFQVYSQIPPAQLKAIPVSNEPSPRSSRLNSSASSAAAGIVAQQLQLQEQMRLQEQMQQEQQLLQQQQQLQEQMQRQQLLHQQQQQLQPMGPWFPGMQQPGLAWPGSLHAAPGGTWMTGPAGLAGMAGMAGTPGLMSSVQYGHGWPAATLSGTNGSLGLAGAADFKTSVGGSALQGGLAAMAVVKAERQQQQQQQGHGGRVYEYTPDLSGVLPGVGLVVRLKQQGSTGRQDPASSDGVLRTPGGSMITHSNPLYHGESLSAQEGSGRLAWTHECRSSTAHLSSQAADAICEAASAAGDAAVDAVAEAVAALQRSGYRAQYRQSSMMPMQKSTSPHSGMVDGSGTTSHSERSPICMPSGTPPSARGRAPSWRTSN